MKKLIIVLLVASLTTNAWLLWRKSSGRNAADGSGPAIPETARSAKGGETSTTGKADKLIVALDTFDLPALCDAIRAAGLDEPSVRAIAEGTLRQRYREQASRWRRERGWWRGSSFINRVDYGGLGAPSQRKLVVDPLRTLLGPDPLDLADGEIRYEFLPPEKRRMLAMIDLDYAELQARSAEDRTGAATKSELDEQQMLSREQRKDVLATLTNEERAEYDLRFGQVAMNNVQRFAAMGATEQEFRTIAPLLDAYDQQLKALQPGDPSRVNARAEMEQRTMDQLVASLGYERALDYLWGVASGPYLPTVRLMQELQLPTSHAAQLLQLAAETGVKAAAVHRGDTLTVDQKRAALVSLQVAARPQLDALVPPEAQTKLPAEAIAWFTALGDGRYAPHRTAATSNVWYVATPISVTLPPRTPLLPVPLPRK